MATYNKASRAQKITNSGDVTKQFTTAIKDTTFTLPDFVYDDNGMAHTIKNALTRIVFSPDSLKQSGAPRGFVRREASAVHYLVNSQDIDGKIENVIMTWAENANLGEDMPFDYDLLEALVQACMVRKFPLTSPAGAVAYDLAPFVMFIFAVSVVSRSPEISRDFVINEPCTNFLSDRDVKRFDSEMRSRLGAAFFFRLNDDNKVNRNDFNHADTIVIKTLINEAFNVGHTWENYYTIRDAVSGVRSLLEYRHLVLNAEGGEA